LGFLAHENGVPQKMRTQCFGLDSRVAVLIDSQFKKPLLLDGKLSFKMWKEGGERRRRKRRRGTQGESFLGPFTIQINNTNLILSSSSPKHYHLLALLLTW
jgi:hypothetical protein